MLATDPPPARSEAGRISRNNLLRPATAGDKQVIWLMLDEYWNRNFDQSRPLAHELRELYRKRWVRFHSLPDSKRYAETDSDWATLLERHNTLVDRLTDDGCQIELLTTNWSSGRQPLSAPSEFLELDLPTIHWRSFAKNDDASNWWHLFHTQITWNYGTLDRVFRLVAENEISNVMLVDPTDNWLIHPYDGGLDMILGSRTERDTMSSEFASWRSKRSDGL